MTRRLGYDNHRYNSCKRCFSVDECSATYFFFSGGFVFNGNQKSIMMSIFLLALPLYLDKEKKQRTTKKEPRNNEGLFNVFRSFLVVVRA